MVYSQESNMSSFDGSFYDPILFGYDDSPVGQPPIWDWNAPLLDHSMNGTPTDSEPSYSFQMSNAATTGGASLDSSPFSDGTALSSVYSPAAYVEDWSLFEESTIRFAPPSATTEYPQSEPTQPTPAMSPVAEVPLARSASSPGTSSQTIVDRPSPSRVAIQRERPRHHHHKSSAKSHAGSANRHYCTVARCKSSFTRQSDLHRHNLDVHSRSGKFYQCGACPYFSRRSDKVKEHCQKMHHQARGHENFTVVVEQA